MRTLATSVDEGRCRWPAVKARRTPTIKAALAAAPVAAPAHCARLPLFCIDDHRSGLGIDVRGRFRAGSPVYRTPASETGITRTQSLDRSYLALPDGPGPFPGVVVVHEASGLNDNIRDICGRFAAEGYAALGADLFEGRNRAVCMARMFSGGMAGNLDYYGVPALKAALSQLAEHPEVDGARIGAIGFCLGGSIVLTWACTDNRLVAIAPFTGPHPSRARRSAACARSWDRGRTRTSPPRPPGCWRPS
jgi:alpha-beta hydrolase superfamily lysophospholipase